MLARVRNLRTAAATYGVPCATDYEVSFDDSPAIKLSAADEFRLRVADESLALLVNDLSQEAASIVTTAGIVDSSDAEVSRIVRRFKRVTPAEGCRCIADILNAAWRASLDPTFWSGLPVIDQRGASVLRELALKNLEIFEIEQLQRDANAP
jgi:hypothetical protein